MKKLEFNNENDYLSFIESLLTKNISEIIKTSSRDYVFKIDGIWYNVFYSMLVGTTFSDGESLFLQIGIDRFNFEQSCAMQFRDKRISAIFELLHNIYAKHLIVHHDLVKEAALSITEFLLSCDYIEKLHETVFLVTKQNTQYYIKESFIYKDERLTSNLSIYKIKDKKNILIKTMENGIAPAIISFLNFSFYVSRSNNLANIKDTFLKELK